ncbi:prepilin-type N-terminal cleavage/methylation domain-containing protein [Candidatus Saccharibacteria bacterium]|nr:prepilin-type N-terminal cleavage/methylation domain-containing protein [Candidatus Saccharibacteria bacterium]
MHKTSENQSGFTIVEMIVAATLSGIVIIAIMTFLTNTIVNNSISSARADLLREAQLALDLLSKDIRLSANVDEFNRWPDANAPSAPANEYSWEADTDTLILATAANDQYQDVIFEDALHYITYKNNNIYFIENGSLYKRTLAADSPLNGALTSCPAASATTLCPADKKLVDGVTGLTVRYVNSFDVDVPPGEARSVEVTITLLKEKFNRDITAEYITRSVFRNE